MLAVFGLLLWVAAGVLWWISQKNLVRAGEMAATETITAGALKELCQEVAKEVGSGSFRQRVELKGMLRCSQPVQAELSKQPCAMSVTTVERKYEETVQERDSQGHTRHVTRTGSEQVSELKQVAAEVMVEDATGTVLVCLDEASPELKTVVDRFSPHQEQLEEGLARLLTHAVLNHHGHGRRTLGYRSVERIFPVDQRVYVLGEASDAGGTLRVGKGKTELMVSLKSEEQLTAEARKTATWTRVGAAICVVAGLGLVVGNFFVR